MNHRTLTLTATIGLLTLTSACTPAQVGRMLTTHHKTAPAVVETVPTVAVVTLPGLSVTVAVDPPQPGPGPEPRPWTPEPSMVQCDDGSFAEQGDCPPPLTPSTQGLD